MKDEIGKIPKIKNTKHALREILRIAKDKKIHVLITDCNEWLELKMKVIGIIAKRGLK
jgi:hypothetical protein